MSVCMHDLIYTESGNKFQSRIVMYNSDGVAVDRQ